MRLARLCWHSRAGKGNSRRDLAGQGGARVFQLALKTDACVRVLLEVAVENVGDDEVAGAVGMSDGAVFRCLNVHVCLCPQHPEGGIAPQTKIARHPIQDDGQPLGTVFSDPLGHISAFADTTVVFHSVGAFACAKASECLERG